MEAIFFLLVLAVGVIFILNIDTSQSDSSSETPPETSSKSSRNRQ
jgi:hypothetical protein